MEYNVTPIYGIHGRSRVAHSSIDPHINWVYNTYIYIYIARYSSGRFYWAAINSADHNLTSKLNESQLDNVLGKSKCWNAKETVLALEKGVINTEINILYIMMYVYINLQLYIYICLRWMYIFQILQQFESLTKFHRKLVTLCGQTSIDFPLRLTISLCLWNISRWPETEKNQSSNWSAPLRLASRHESLCSLWSPFNYSQYTNNSDCSLWYIKSPFIEWDQCDTQH